MRCDPIISQYGPCHRHTPTPSWCSPPPVEIPLWVKCSRTVPHCTRPDQRWLRLINSHYPTHTHAHAHTHTSCLSSVSPPVSVGLSLTGGVSGVSQAGLAHLYSGSGIQGRFPLKGQTSQRHDADIYPHQGEQIVLHTYRT